MTKQTKAKPGSAAELAEMYPGPKSIPVRITRVTGAGETRAVEVRQIKVLVYALPIQQLARLVEILEPVMVAMSEPKRVIQFIAENTDAVYAAVAEATGYPVEDVAGFDGDGFMSVVFGILEMNSAFFVRLLALAGSGFQEIATGEPGNGAGKGQSPTFAGGGTPTPSATHSPSSMPQ